MSLSFIYKGSYVLWKLRNKLKRSLKFNFIVIRQGLFKLSGVLLLLGWFVFVVLIILYPNLIITI